MTTTNNTTQATITRSFIKRPSEDNLLNRSVSFQVHETQSLKDSDLIEINVFDENNNLIYKIVNLSAKELKNNLKNKGNFSYYRF